MTVPCAKSDHQLSVLEQPNGSFAKEFGGKWEKCVKCGWWIPVKDDLNRSRRIVTQHDTVVRMTYKGIDLCRHSAQSWSLDKKTDQMYCDDCDGPIDQDPETGFWYKKEKTDG